MGWSGIGGDWRGCEGRGCESRGWDGMEWNGISYAYLLCNVIFDYNCYLFQSFCIDRYPVSVFHFSLLVLFPFF